MGISSDDHECDESAGTIARSQHAIKAGDVQMFERLLLE